MTEKSEIKKPSEGLIGPKEAADALNEQGFLFAQVLRDRIDNRIEFTRHQSFWELTAQEYPVTATDDSQTRIDLILRSRRTRNVFLCVEAKRPNRKYKSWVFFDRQPNRSTLFLETVDTYTPQGLTNPNPPQHKIAHKQPANSYDVFNYYLEVALKKNSDNASSTDTIEKAMRQLIAGQTGLIKKLGSLDEQLPYFRSIPVIVTSAQLFEAKFAIEKVDRENGTILEKDLELKPLEFCAVNYHADDSLSLKSPWGARRKDSVQTDIAHFQTRTVFLTQASALDNFLIWADGNLTDMS